LPVSSLASDASLVFGPVEGCVSEFGKSNASKRKQEEAKSAVPGASLARRIFPGYVETCPAVERH
jgi:hypothetical protein